MINEEYIDRTMRLYGMYDATSAHVTQTTVVTGGNSVSQTVYINKFGFEDVHVRTDVGPIKTRYARLIRWIKSWLS